jgi:hypothetical protein
MRLDPIPASQAKIIVFTVSPGIDLDMLILLVKISGRSGVFQKVTAPARL